MTARQKRKVAPLERRRAWLAGRIEHYGEGDPSRDLAEKGAIDWALAIIFAADSADVLNDLDQRAVRAE